MGIFEISYQDIRNGKAGIDSTGLVPIRYIQSPLYPQQFVPVSQLRVFAITHQHLDHLPFADNLILVVPAPIAKIVDGVYAKVGLKPKIIPHKEFEETHHYGWHSDGTYRKALSYVLRFKDFVCIPESAEQRRLLEKYRSFEHGVICRVPPSDTLETPPQPEEIPEKWLISNSASFGRPRDNIIPKCIPSIADGVLLRGETLVRRIYRYR